MGPSVHAWPGIFKAWRAGRRTIGRRALFAALWGATLGHILAVAGAVHSPVRIRIFQRTSTPSHNAHLSPAAAIVCCSTHTTVRTSNTTSTSLPPGSRKVAWWERLRYLSIARPRKHSQPHAPSVHVTRPGASSRRAQPTARTDGHPCITCDSRGTRCRSMIDTKIGRPVRTSYDGSLSRPCCTSLEGMWHTGAAHGSTHPGHGRLAAGQNKERPLAGIGDYLVLVSEQRNGRERIRNASS
ncbi:hypothetical protein BC628DRAFT_651719 [Trametes gibbosa]|nr:hypothetical protein BC628DRAFT_651719 [Trametes gibbosa]